MLLAENGQKCPIFCGFRFTSESHFRIIELTKEELKTFSRLCVLVNLQHVREESNLLLHFIF
jgi:hypothetical protein